MTRALLDVLYVAAYELGEAMRTRLLQLVLLGYCGGVAMSNMLFFAALSQAEASLAETMGVPPTERPGALVGELVKNGQLLDLIGPVVGGGGGSELLQRPVLALWAGAVSMVLLPLVLLFSASGSIAAEVRTRSVRYLLCRTGRLQVGLGKLVGQLLLAAVAGALGALVTWGMGMTLMVGNPPGALALELLNRTARAAIFALPLAGMGLAASQWVSSPNGARFLGGLVALGTLWAGDWLGEHAGPDTLGRLADLGTLLLGEGLWTDLWATDLGSLQAAAARCVALAVAWYALGYAVFARRDL